MSELIEIQSQIEKLQKQASDIKAREFGKTVQDILVKMQAFGITLKDLQPGKARGAKGKAKAAKVALPTLAALALPLAPRALPGCKSFRVIPKACIFTKISCTVLPNSRALMSLACFCSFSI